MEQFIQTLPKPVLVLGALIIGVILTMILNPPHTICHTQVEQVTETLAGVTKPLKLKKQTLPPRIEAALDACYQGRTSGACHDYFQILKGLAKSVLTVATECRAEVYGISDIRKRLQEGVENLAIMGWGDEPPDPEAADRFGPLQDSEIALFCYIKSAVIAGETEAGWHKIRKKIFDKLPGEKVKLPTDPKEVLAQARPAPKVLSELDIWNRSLFSIRCENYL